MRRAPKFKKFGETVVAATIGYYLVNLDLWKISSLDNRLFDNKATMLNSSRYMDFPKGNICTFKH